MLKNIFKSYTFFPAQHWSHSWERQHEIATRLAKVIEKPVYICNPLGMINYNLLSVEFFNKIKHYKDYFGGQNDIKNNPLLHNMYQVHGLFIPYHNSVTGKINYQLLKRKIKFSENNFFWSTYINPTIYEFFKRSSFKVYDIAERRSVNPLVPKYIKDLERRVIAEADVVFIDNHAAIDDYKNLNPNIYYIPQGVNIEEVNQQQQQENRKYIGYIGNFHFAIDYDFLEQLIVLNSDQPFLLVGKIMTDKMNRILSLPNVEHINHVPKYRLSEFLSKMKIGLIPYLINDVTIGVYPTKLFEYLAANVPVVSTPLPEVIQYSDPNFLKIIEAPQTLNNINFNMCRVQEIVLENTWDSRFNQYINCITECIK